MSFGLISASSTQIGKSRKPSVSETSKTHEKARTLLPDNQYDSLKIEEKPIIENENSLSIAYLHKKVEQELEEKQRKVTLLRQPSIRKPNTPPNNVRKKSEKKKDENLGCINWGSCCGSHSNIAVIIALCLGF